MNGKGPEGKGELTGRGLGKCQDTNDNDALNKLGKGMGLRRKAGGGEGQGKRLRSGI
ncbi:MAG TPA: DUF5320 family protein [Mariniphaga sp.]|nr:DUF5320 family protein [Mariniphaga sp.]